jgi:chromosomal replication initiator protein
MSVSSQGTSSGHAWSNFLSRVQTLVNEQTFRTWFEPLQLQGIDGDRAVIGCPNRFFMDWIAEHHMDKITYAFREVLGAAIQVQLVAPPEAADEYAARRSAPRPVRPTPRPRGINEGERLNPKYTMDEFVVGSNSQMTYAACLAVAEKPAIIYNPLFIYGGVGLGKTHLMQAIGHLVLEQHGGARVHYNSAEAFMNEMIMAIRKGNGHDFRTRYRNVDLLLIDDVQFLAGKESTQEEFFHTFNALHGAAKQIVVTSDRPPKEIPRLEERLMSRFEWGLITDIQPPEYETRLAILRKKVERENISIPEEVLALIAESVKSNIRELEGSLVKLLVHASVFKKDVTVDVANDVLKDFVKDSTKPPAISTIQKVVAMHYKIPVEAMRSKIRTARLAFPRQVAIYLARELTQASLTQIGQRFGGRDHTTVIHAYQKIKELVERDVALKASVNQLRRDLS